MPLHKPSYIGRFAPSPSGELHMGSLVCALASYLDAKTHHGKWLVRIEDIDPPREQPGASQSILNTLQQHHLFWDDEVLFQSARSLIYKKHLDTLHKKQLIYPCSCTRARLKSITVRYDQHCLHSPPDTSEPCSLRLNLTHLLSQQTLYFNDELQGGFEQTIAKQSDFVIHRKDGLFAYQLAVNADDIAQNITHIVRGSDLLETTFDYLITRHALLNHSAQRRLPDLQFCHIPVVLDSNKRKMSKQNHAQPLNNNLAEDNILVALRFLSFDTTGAPKSDVKALLHWAQPRWLIAKSQLKRIQSKPL